MPQKIIYYLWPSLRELDELIESLIYAEWPEFKDDIDD